MIRSSEVSGEQLWLLDEGHCFRDQLDAFRQLNPPSLVKLHTGWEAWKLSCAW